MGLDGDSSCGQERKRSHGQCPDEIMRQSFNTGGQVQRQEYSHGRSVKKKKSTGDEIKEVLTVASPYIAMGGAGALAWGGKKVYDRFKNSISPETRTKIETTVNTIKDGAKKINDYRNNPENIVKDAYNHFSKKQPAQIEEAPAHRTRVPVPQAQPTHPTQMYHNLQQQREPDEYADGGNVVIREEKIFVPQSRKDMPFGIDPQLAQNAFKKPSVSGDYSGMGRNSGNKGFASADVKNTKGIRELTPSMNSTIAKANVRRNAGASGVYNEIGSPNAALPRSEQIDKFYESKRPTSTKHSNFVKDDFNVGMNQRSKKAMPFVAEETIEYKPKSRGAFDPSILNPAPTHHKINKYKRHK